MPGLIKDPAIQPREDARPHEAVAVKAQCDACGGWRIHDDWPARDVRDVDQDWSTASTGALWWSRCRGCGLIHITNVINRSWPRERLRGGPRCG